MSRTYKTLRYLNHEIANLEDRILNAQTLEAAKDWHRRLDELRKRRDELRRTHDEIAR